MSVKGTARYHGPEMALFRALSSFDIEEILASFGVAPGSYVRHEPIVAGTINTNIRVDTLDGRRFLRVNEGKGEDDVAREAAILDHLAAGGLSTPRPLRTRAATPYLRWREQLVSLFPWVDGRVLTRAELTGDHAAQLGHHLGRLHNLGGSFADHRPGRYEPDQLQRRLAMVESVVSVGDGGSNGREREPELVDAIRRIAPELERLASERAGAVPLGLIHGDLFVDNVLFSGARGHEALVALLDFEQASWGRLIYDVAVTALSLAFGRDDFRFDLLRDFLAGYGAERRLSGPERRVFGAELRFASCRFALTRITDVHLKRDAGAPAGKDFRRYLLRLQRVKEHLSANPEVFLGFRVD